jgi:hypothetical protein
MELLKDEITVILTVWKRDYLKHQIPLILKQTKKPYQVWIYQNESHLNIPDDIRKQLNISLIQSKDINFKFHGRFTLPLLCNTEYIALFDDDSMPGEQWLENCLATSKRHNCIVGANGRILKDDFLQSDVESSVGLGDGAPINEEMEVDFNGHCWFFKTEWCKYIWYDRPKTWNNGEDIHFAAACQIHGGIKSYIPRMPAGDRKEWGDIEPRFGHDEYATWRNPDHSYLRSEIMKHWYKKGWKPIRMR